MTERELLKRPRGKYPRYASEFADLEALIEKYVLPGSIPAKPILDRTKLVMTQGSCFAENIAYVLKANKVSVYNLTVPEFVNSPRANELFYRHLMDPALPYANPSQAKIFAPVQALRDFDWSKVHLFLFTMGVAPYFVRDGAETFDMTSESGDSDDMKYPTVAEVEASIDFVFSVVRKLNPAIKIVFTLSPVPLNSFLGANSGVTADCVSKSILRVAAHNYLQRGIPDTYYWPSFEIIRWLGAHLPPVFGADDGLARHVNNAMINLVVKLFLKHYAIMT